MLLLTYKIQSLLEQHREPFLSREEILARQLEKNLFKVGDKVKFKKPRRNPVYGVIKSIGTDWKQVNWRNGGLIPNNIEVQTSANDVCMVTNMKRIIYAGKGTQ